MLKVQVTKKQVMNSYRHVICVGGSSLYYLLRFKDARFYTAGIYGWNADVYEISNNTVIVMGDRPFGNIEPEYDIARGFEDRAREIIVRSDFLEYAEQEKAIDDLLDEFMQVVLKMNN